MSDRLGLVGPDVGRGVQRLAPLIGSRHDDASDRRAPGADGGAAGEQRDGLRGTAVIGQAGRETRVGDADQIVVDLVGQAARCRSGCTSWWRTTEPTMSLAGAVVPVPIVLRTTIGVVERGRAGIDVDAAADAAGSHDVVGDRAADDRQGCRRCRWRRRTGWPSCSPGCWRTIVIVPPKLLEIGATLERRVAGERAVRDRHGAQGRSGAVVEQAAALVGRVAHDGRVGDRTSCRPD